MMRRRTHWLEMQTLESNMKLEMVVVCLVACRILGQSIDGIGHYRKITPNDDGRSSTQKADMCPDGVAKCDWQYSTTQKVLQGSRVAEDGDLICPPGCTLLGTVCSCLNKAEPGRHRKKGGKSKCQPGCSLQDGLCLCNYPAIIGAGIPAQSSERACPIGCTTERGRCCCIYPAQKVVAPQEHGSTVIYLCVAGCITLSKNRCFCAVNGGEGMVESVSTKRYMCQNGCNLVNGFCTCSWQPHKETSSGGDIINVCPNDCALQGTICFCVTSPKEVSRDSKDPPVAAPSYKCQAGCSLQKSVCLCIYPVIELSSPEGAGLPTRYICPTGCTIKGRVCECISHPQDYEQGLDDSGPTHICQQGCTLQNGYCYCLQPAELVKSTHPGVYICPHGCMLQGQYCLCLQLPATQIEDDPDEPETKDCPAPPTKEELLKICKKIIKQPICPTPQPPPPTKAPRPKPKEKIHTADACAGERIHLQCLPNEYITVHSVFWGRKWKLSCGRVGGSDCEDKDGKALAYVTGQCEYLSICDIFVSDKAERLGNPCGKMPKLLRVQYKCIPTEKTGVKFDYACWKKPLRLKCSSGEIIRIQYATLGRDNLELCNKGNVRKINCRSYHSISCIASKCQNKNVCEVRDFCATVCKSEKQSLYMSASYFCVRDKDIYKRKGPPSPDSFEESPEWTPS